MPIVWTNGRKYSYVDYHDLAKKLKITNKEARQLIRDTNLQRETKRSKTIQKYQKTDKFKEYKRARYFQKVRDEYVIKTAKFIVEFDKKSEHSVRNELDIFEMIENAKNTREIKDIYSNLIFHIETVV